MKYSTVSDIAGSWNVSERSVRNYCAQGRVEGAYRDGRDWMIPAGAAKPNRKHRTGKLPDTLLERLREEQESGLSGGIYHRLQIDLTYSSNHIEGSRLTHDQTRYIFETNAIGFDTCSVINTDDIVETMNHFRCVDHVIRTARRPLSESMIKGLHHTLKAGSSDSRKPWFAVGDYKRLANEVGGQETTSPEDVPSVMRELLDTYNAAEAKTLDDLLDFHVSFERIHPFQDGNGRVGRLILFKECLHWDIVPFMITDDLKMFYYRGLQNWNHERGWLRDTVLTAQDRFKTLLRRFQIRYAE